MSKIQAAINTLLSGADGSMGKDSRAALLVELKVNLSLFEKELIDHFDHEELFAVSPVARKVSSCS